MNRDTLIGLVLFLMIFLAVMFLFISPTLTETLGVAGTMLSALIVLVVFGVIFSKVR